MSTTAPPSSRLRRALALTLVCATLGLVGLAVTSTLRAPEAEDDVGAASGLERLERQAARARSNQLRLRDLDVLEARRSYQQAQRERAYSDRDPKVATFTRDEAVASFEALMDHLDAMAASDKRLGKKQKAELYRAANDTFAAMASKLDPTEHDDATQLENASITLREQLLRLGIEPTPFQEEGQLLKRTRRQRPSGRRHG